jgi:hypothetical protein
VRPLRKPSPTLATVSLSGLASFAVIFDKTAGTGLPSNAVVASRSGRITFEKFVCIKPEMSEESLLRLA